MPSPCHAGIPIGIPQKTSARTPTWQPKRSLHGPSATILETRESRLTVQNLLHGFGQRTELFVSGRLGRVFRHGEPAGHGLRHRYALPDGGQDLLAHVLERGCQPPAQVGTHENLGWHEADARLFRTPLGAGFERQRQGLLQGEQVKRRRPTWQQHKVRRQRRLVCRLGHARRRVDEDDIGVLFGCTRARPQGCGAVRDFLDAARQHSVALLRPCRQAVLRLGVYHRHALPHPGELPRQVADDGGFAYPALPSRNGDDGHRQYYTGIPPRRHVPRNRWGTSTARAVVPLAAIAVYWAARGSRNPTPSPEAAHDEEVPRLWFPSPVVRGAAVRPDTGPGQRSGQGTECTRNPL